MLQENIPQYNSVHPTINVKIWMYGWNFCTPSRKKHWTYFDESLQCYSLNTRIAHAL